MPINFILKLSRIVENFTEKEITFTLYLKQQNYIIVL